MSLDRHLIGKIEQTPMNKKRLTLIIAFMAVCFGALAASTESLNQRLHSLRSELLRDYKQMAVTKEKISDKYELQHQKMIGIIKKCDALSLRLYSQKQEYTLDLCFALEQVKDEYEAFNKDRLPYDRVVSSLDIEIDRCARLIEALRRLPPEKQHVRNLHDSLAYHNDSLDQYCRANQDWHFNPSEDSRVLGLPETVLFKLDKEGERNRDTCLYFATELLKMYIESRDIIVADSIHYYIAYLRLKESYDYTRQYYKVLQKRIFIEGQTPWPVILSDPQYYWDEAVNDMKNKYQVFFVNRDGHPSPTDSPSAIDTSSTSIAINDTIPADSAFSPSPMEANPLASGNEADSDNNSYENISWDHSILLVSILIMFFGLLLCWLIAWLLLFPVFRFVKPLRRSVAKEQRRGIILLFAIVLFVLFSNNIFNTNDLLEKAIKLSGTFMWLLAAIVTALLIRLKPKQLKNTGRLYTPTIFMALVVISIRSAFMPNTAMNFIFPPLLIVFFLWQLTAFLLYRKKAEKTDRFISWVSLIVTAAALVGSIVGYIFVSLQVLIWWYFQMAVIHTMTTIRYLINLYKKKRVEHRVNEFRERITFVSGADKEALLFGATWFYDLFREVVIPLLGLMSIPFCIRLAMNVFDFDDLYRGLYYQPFFQYTDSNGVTNFRISFYSIILLTGLVFVFRYLSKALHVLWQHSRYTMFMRKNNRQSIRKNEINLTFGNSLISVLVWMTYAIIVIFTFHIPTGSLGLIAGGFSAGVGLALKDLINNFAYGIQLMSGRLKIGDWIECDGVRGCVTNISYQSTQVETINNTTVSFLNSALFAKSFTNLTKSNSYELLKIQVQVAYGTDIQHVREVLEEAMQVMRTKDPYGREVVEPSKGVYVVLGDFGESGVEIWVKQYILAAERIGYIDRAKEVIYNALNANGIAIPFPQCDIHVINDETPNFSEASPQ